jgi:hypothetical protein
MECLGSRDGEGKIRAERLKITGQRNLVFVRGVNDEGENVANEKEHSIMYSQRLVATLSRSPCFRHQVSRDP